MTLRFDKALPFASLSIYARCVLELEKAVTLEFGNSSARYNDAEPHPQLDDVS
jgi:hypothetical protein